MIKEWNYLAKDGQIYFIEVDYDWFWDVEEQNYLLDIYTVGIYHGDKPITDKIIVKEIMDQVEKQEYERDE